MQILLYQQKITDKKHNIVFNKDKISYQRKTFDAILTHAFRDVLEAAIAENKITYPILLDVDDECYFTKAKEYTRNDGTKGQKAVIVIKRAKSISQGKFENGKSLDDLVNELKNPIPGSEVFDEVDEEE